jgi:hypothetical protein
VLKFKYKNIEERRWVVATLTNAKKGVLAKILAGASIAAILFVLGEFLLAGPILFFVEVLGLGIGLGYVAFCLTWSCLGILSLTLWNLFFKERQSVGKTESKPKNWRERTVLWISRSARSFGALTAMFLLGPIFAWTVFKLLGYTERTVYVLTLISAWVFGGIWVPIYAGAWDISLSRLF